LDPESPTGRLYRTGDLGRVEDECLHYLGRVDRQVKVAGVRMELDEVEAVLSRHPCVGHCAVVLSGEETAHGLTAYFVASAPVTPEDLEAHLRAALPAAMVPRTWHRLDALPLTPNGKVDHRTLIATDPSVS
jgi:acyl-coenzyme A synthetase/AMP-(fatty) acid ligase